MRQMLRIVFLSLIGFGMISPKVFGQGIASFEISIPDGASAFPIGLDLDEITHLADTLLDLVEVVNGQHYPVNHQIEKEGGRRLVWMLQPGVSQREFTLIERASTLQKPVINTTKKDGGIVIGNHTRPLLRYNFATMFPPDGVDEVFKRSGFIHPFWSPAGKVLTRVQPPDHYHHYGLWNPWTKVEFKGKQVDFWNLGEKQGTVRFANFISTESGPVFGALKVLHEHVVFDGDEEEVALNEVQGVKIYQSENQQDAYFMDISIQLKCATDSPVILKEYRYGGLGWRATELWDRNNSEVLTSDGNNRATSDGSLARWCIVQGELDDGFASVVMMSFPTNYNHPEPLRIWPEDIYDRGDMFANFSPTKDKDWPLEPNKLYELNYRFYVSDKKISAEEAERLWQQYAHPPAINIKSIAQKQPSNISNVQKPN